MSKAHLLLVLHMHQPYYFDPQARIYRLPWVRLHAIREYYDVVSLALQHNEARLTINLVPSLLLQLSDYERDPSNDLFWRLTEANPADLDEAQKRFVLTNFFLANWKHMIFRLPRYRELLEKRGRDVKRVDWKRALRSFSNQDILDLQVLFNLAWFGFTAEAEFAELRELKRKGRGFDEADKQTVLQLQHEVLKRVVPRYREAAESGRIELTTSAAFHPILPLLIDNGIARRCMPNVRLPREPFRYPEDARDQIEVGKQIFEERLNVVPRGFWPSEGSVCPELVPMLEEAGFEWFATDEDIIKSTLPLRSRDELIYKAWNVEHNGKTVAAIFRDKYLSDLIGFTYARNPAKSAVAHFVGKLEEIADTVGEGAQIAVILDGENPWEHYENGGRDFLTLLFDEVAQSRTIQMRTVSDSLAENPPKETVRELYSASWINNDFGIWIGGDEENRAWEYLAAARRALEDFGERSATSYHKARQALFAAEGSDWFWWYGEKFASETPELFDELFRAHIARAYKLLGVPTPEFVSVPILRRRTSKRTLSIREFITPVLDGKITNYYEWWGAAAVDLQQIASTGDGAMAHTQHLLRRLFVGFDAKRLYVRLDFAENAEELKQAILDGKAEIELFFLEPDCKRSCRAVAIADGEGGMTLHILKGDDSGGIDEFAEAVGKAVLDEVLELAIPLEVLCREGLTEVNFAVRVLSGDGEGFELARYPHHGYFLLPLPDESFATRNWTVL